MAKGRPRTTRLPGIEKFTQFFEIDGFLPDFEEGCPGSFGLVVMISADKIELEGGEIGQDEVCFIPSEAIGQVIVEEYNVRRVFLQELHSFLQAMRNGYVVLET